MNYVTAGYIVTFLVLGVYAASVIRRQRVLRRYLRAEMAAIDLPSSQTESVVGTGRSGVEGARNAEHEPGQVVGALDDDQ